MILEKSRTLFDTMEVFIKKRLKLLKNDQKRSKMSQNSSKRANNHQKWALFY